MGILDEDIQRVREATDIVAVIGEHVQLKRVGRRWQGLCPFHGEKSPSFSVNAEEGLYYCFGCQAKGDAITFVREIERLDFVGAVERLAGRAGITLRYTDANEQQNRRKRAELYDAVEAAVAWYHDRLLSASDAGEARRYLRSRGFDGDDVRAYRLGWAPDAWDTLAKALKLPDQVLVDAGLGFLNRNHRQTDAFRGRLLFPIFDVEGRALGFGGRILPGGEGPKYKNSAENAIYNKSKVLYGLNWAKAEIVQADEAIVCEGYTDVIGFAKAGVGRAVATCGTALTDEHFRVLRSFARRIVLAFDADAAGQNAAERFYEWEQHHDVDVVVAALPAGVDPGDLAREDPAALAAAVADAVPFLEFRVRRVLAAAPTTTAEQRARAAEAALAVVAEHPSPLVRDQYLMTIADRTGIDPDLLRTQAAAGPRTAPPASGGRGRDGRDGREGRRGDGPSGRRSDGRRDQAAARRVGSSIDGPEVEALRLLVTHRDDMLEWLSEPLFADELVLSAFRSMREHASVLAATEAADPGAAELIQRAAVEDTESEPIDVIDLLLVEAGRRELRRLDAAARHSDDPLQYARTIGSVKLLVEELQSEHRSVEAREQLLALLRQPAEGGG